MLSQKPFENVMRFLKNHDSKKISGGALRDPSDWRVFQQLIAQIDFHSSKARDESLSQKYQNKGLNSSAFLLTIIWHCVEKSISLLDQVERQGSGITDSAQDLFSAGRGDIIPICTEPISDIKTLDLIDKEVDESTVEEDGGEDERPGDGKNVHQDDYDSASATNTSNNNNNNNNNNNSNKETNSAGSSFAGAGGAGGAGGEGGGDDRKGVDEGRKENPKRRRKPRNQRKSRTRARPTSKTKRRLQSRLRSKMMSLARQTTSRANRRKGLARLADIAWPMAMSVDKDVSASGKRFSGLQWRCRSHRKASLPPWTPSQSRTGRKGFFQDPFASSRFPSDQLSRFKNGPWARGALRVRPHVELAVSNSSQLPRQRRRSESYWEKRKKNAKRPDLDPQQAEGQGPRQEDAGNSTDNRQDQDGEPQQHVSRSENSKTSVQCMDDTLGEFGGTTVTFSLPPLQHDDGLAISTLVLSPDLHPETTARVQGLNLRPGNIVHGQCEEDLLLQDEIRRRPRGNIRHLETHGQGGEEDEGNT